MNNLQLYLFTRFFPANKIIYGIRIVLASPYKKQIITAKIMETTKTKKMSVLTFVLALTGIAAFKFAPDNGFQSMMENEQIIKIKKKLHAYYSKLPEDRVYIQTDKPLYSAGENIWFTALIRDAQNMQASEKSEILHMDLINPKGSVEKALHLICKNGRAAGDFQLDEELVGGLYKIKAYTNWMKNEGENNYFEKEIQIQDIVLPNLKMKLDFEKKAFGPGDEVIAKLELNTNENKPLSNHEIKFVSSLNGSKHYEQKSETDADGICYIKYKLPGKLKSNDGLLNALIEYNGSTESISRSIPIVLNTVKLRLFPEGGDLVYGIESVVAFKATNEFGKPADIEGVIIDEEGREINAFKSFHQGMGSFYLTPIKEKKYKIKITKPSSVTELYEIPQAGERGYVLSVNNQTDGQLNVSVNSTEAEDLALIAQIRGKIVYSTIVHSMEGKNDFAVSTKNFPMGIAQLTLFDSKGIARAERLVFVNKNNHLSIHLQTDKQKYLPREKIKLTVTVKDERGLPAPANLAISVVNDQLLSFANDKSGNILSQLFLQQDLKEKIEDPSFYFDKNEKKSDRALDYLLLTSGWRRFTWEKLLEEEIPPVIYPAQKAILAGKIMDGNSGKGLQDAKIKLPNGNEYSCDENGNFSFHYTEFYTPLMLKIDAPGFNAHTQMVQDFSENLSVYLNNYRIEQIGSAQLKHIEIAGESLEEELVQLAPVMEDQKMVAEPVLNSRGIKKVILANAAQPAREKTKRNHAVKEIAALDDRLIVNGQRKKQFQNKDDIDQNSPSLYYRAREFYAPTYDKQEVNALRTDFRNTIYWNPDLQIGYSGKKTVEFYASDDISSFKVTAEGISKNGQAGCSDHTFYTQLPFEMKLKIPSEVVAEDVISIPLTLKNNSNGPLGGVLRLSIPDILQSIKPIDSVQTIMPGEAKTLFLNYKVSHKSGDGNFDISFQSCGLSDAMTQKIKVVSKGFPVSLSFSSQEIQKEFDVEYNHLVKGSLKASFTAFPNVVNDLMKGVEGILSEPNGCFEQTSCTAYPNAMVLDYLKATESKDVKVLAKATDLLDRGYKRLTGFETSNRGYEWFGANPAHEGLTAYGIMEFVDMQKAGQSIDKQMLDRTVQWLMNHKDGKGGFQRERRALHDFGRISDDVLNGYIVYALAEAGYKDVQKEFESSFKIATETKDAYLLAMSCNAAFSLNQLKKANESLQLLFSLQEKDGSINGSTHSITYSQGQSLRIETTALSLLAMLKSPVKNETSIQRAVKYLIESRSGSGVFSSTQGTILALKALTEFAKYNKKIPEDGKIEIFIDRKKVIEREFNAGDRNEIQLNGLEKYLQQDGKHTIRVIYKNVKQALPYALAINWHTTLPEANSECEVDLKTVLTATRVNVGETIRLNVQLQNKSDREIPSTIAIIGIPAGLSVQLWQLKELQEKNVFDYYEIKGNKLALYYRGLNSNELKDIRFDLKAEVPGTYEAPASCAYLYYTNEFKSWTAGQKITIASN